MIINLVSGNANKIKEIKRILGSEIEVVSYPLDLPEIQGEAEEIAIQKCLEAVKQINGPVVTEDTSIEFNALNGLPGPYVKWFLQKLGIEGMVKLLSLYDDKTAKGRCICAYCPGPGQEVQLFIGETSGKIVEPRGSQTFGFDPIFEPDGYDQTYGELDPSIKNEISHRYLAFMKLKEYLLR